MTATHQPATDKITLRESFTRFDDHWNPRIVADMNDHHVQLAKVPGEFVWHRHENTDELFLVVQGRLTIKLCDDDIELHEGELFVVPRGVEHMPVAEHEAHVLLLEPMGTVNTGDASDERTVSEEERI